MKTFTCKLIKPRLWHTIALASFMPSYITNTFSNRSNDAQIEGASPGTR